MRTNLAERLGYEPEESTEERQKFLLIINASLDNNNNCKI